MLYLPPVSSGKVTSSTISKRIFTAPNQASHFFSNIKTFSSIRASGPQDSYALPPLFGPTVNSQEVTVADRLNISDFIVYPFTDSVISRPFPANMQKISRSGLTAEYAP